MKPILRFPGFTDEWQVKKLGDLARKVGSGSTPRGGSSVYEVTGVPFIRSQNVTGGKLDLNNIVFIDEKTHKIMSNSAVKPNDVLLNITGASLGRTCVVPDNFTDGNLNQHVCIIRLNESNPYIVHIILSNPKSLHNLLKTQTGGGKEGLNFQAVRSFELALPTQIEQDSIANFLTTVDKKIETLEQKLKKLRSYKCGVIQNIFTQKIRFTKADGSSYPRWTYKKLGETFERLTTKNQRNDKNVLTISAQRGLVSQTEFFNKSVAAKDLTGYYLLQKNDFAYNKSYSAGYPMGAIKRLLNYDLGVVSTLYICFRSRDGSDVDFYDQLFEYGMQNREIEKIAQEGARNHGLLNISVDDFFNIELQVPTSKDEQKRISDFLITIDMKIIHTRSQLFEARAYKRSLHQRMFI